MDRLPFAMAQSLGGAVRYNCEVTGIEQSPSGVRVLFNENGEDGAVDGTRAILTLPFSILRDVVFDPPLPAQKRDVVDMLPYRDATRFLLQTRSRFWHAEGLSGAARTDMPAEIWEASTGQPGEEGLLSVTAGGAEFARRMAAAGGAERLRLGVEMAADAFPKGAEEFQKGITQNWTEERWSKGAFAVTYPGQLTQWWSHMAAPEGRLHFAGEHVSPWPGWMEGAVWSAERATQEIL